MISSYWLFLILSPTIYAFFPISPNVWNLTFNQSWHTVVEMGSVIGNSNYTEECRVGSVLPWSNFYTAFMLQRNCSGPMFSSNTSIGYGSCSIRPYMTWNSTKICIFLGQYSNCTMTNYSVCQTMVNNTLSTNSAPPILPSILPNLTTPLTCADYALPSSYSICLLYNQWYGYNQSACVSYFASNTFLCFAYYDPYYVTGYSQGYGIVEGYQQLNNIILYNVATNLSTSTGVKYRIYESTTQVLFTYPILLSNNISYYVCYCFCLTNMCNVNISTCSSGLTFNCTTPTFIGSIFSVFKIIRTCIVYPFSTKYDFEYHRN